MMKKRFGWFLVCSVLLCSVAHAQTLLVDFTGLSNADFFGGPFEPIITSNAADFAVADPNVDPLAGVNQVNVNVFNDIGVFPSNTPVSGIGVSANLDVNLSIAGAPQPVNGFRQGTPVGAGPRDNLPILDGYLFASENTAPPSLANPTVTLSGISGVTAGSAVTLTVYSIGDVDDQIAPVTFSDGIQSFTSGSTSPSSPFVTFNFTASGSDTFQIFADNSANDSLFAAINGFSISVDPAPESVPEPASGSLIAAIFLGWMGRRRKKS